MILMNKNVYKEFNLVCCMCQVLLIVYLGPNYYYITIIIYYLLHIEEDSYNLD